MSGEGQSKEKTFTGQLSQIDYNYEASVDTVRVVADEFLADYVARTVSASKSVGYLSMRLNLLLERLIQVRGECKDIPCSKVVETVSSLRGDMDFIRICAKALLDEVEKIKVV